MDLTKEIYVTGTGACGFLEANKLLGVDFKLTYKSENGKYQNAYLEQNNSSYPVWNKSKLSKKRIERITKKILERRQISHILIKYVDELIEKNPNILILCLKAPRESTVRKLVWSWGYANPLTSKSRKKLREVNRYPLSQFPDYSDVISPIEATAKFYDEFYALAEVYSKKYPDNFKLIASDICLGEELYKLNLIDQIPTPKCSQNEIFTTNLNGGIGNMLFQISEAKTFAKEFNYPNPRFGYWEEDPNFVFPQFYKPDKEFGGHDVEISDFNAAFENIKLEKFESVTFDTHFQVSNMFNFASFADSSQITIKPNEATRLNAIAVHLRFGGLNADISAVPKIRKSFYKRAFARIPSNLPVYVYSDNLVAAEEWRIKFEKMLNRRIFIKESKPIESLLEMANCEYHILHSSTFSFWSAFLDKEQPNSKVFYPREFLKLHGPNMVPYKSWVCV